MIVKRAWHKTYVTSRRNYEGWFLFGFLPIYIRMSDWS